MLGSQTCNSTVGESSWLGLIQSNLITTTTGTICHLKNHFHGSLIIGYFQSIIQINFGAQIPKSPRVFFGVRVATITWKHNFSILWLCCLCNFKTIFFLGEYEDELAWFMKEKMPLEPWRRRFTFLEYFKC